MWPSCKRPALGGRAQFQVWIFSYTVWAQSSKKQLSRVLMGPADGAGPVEEATPLIERGYPALTQSPPAILATHSDPAFLPVAARKNWYNLTLR